MKQINKTWRTAACAAAILVASTGAGSALTLTLDFSGEPIGAIDGETYSVSKGGLDFTFSGTGLQFRTLSFGISANYGLFSWLSTASDLEPITMTISGGIVNSVRFLNPINGSVIPETDTISAKAFDASSSLLDSVENSNEYNTLLGPDIASIIFDDVDDRTGYVLGSFEIDYDTTVIPLPATLPLMLAGLGGFMVLRRRERA